LEDSIIGNTFALFGPGIIENEFTPKMVFISTLGREGLAGCSILYGCAISVEKTESLF
jgi:hypothetical protein